MHYDVEPAEPHRTGHRWVDFVLAGSALLISCVSLGVAVLHGRTMEQMADANARLVQSNSWPFVAAILSRDNDSVRLGLRNTGVGPAKLHWVQVAYDGKPVASTFDLLHRCCGYAEAAGGRPGAPVDFTYSVVDESVIRAGEAISMISLQRSPANAVVFQALHDGLLKVGYRACYCSVFDECFIGDGQSLKVRHVNDCGEPPVRFDPKP